MTLAPAVAAPAHERHVSERFTELRSRFPATAEAGDPCLALIRRALGPLDGLRVLDLGCGKGRFAGPLARQGAKVMGVDLSAGMLAQGEGFARVRGTGRSLPFADATFDALISVEVFEHLADRGEVLSECRRVLRPGGVLVVIEKSAVALDERRPWLPALLIKWLDTRRRFWMYEPGGPVAERWAWPWASYLRLRSRFSSVQCEPVLSREESAHWAFRALPWARLRLGWVATRGEGTGA